MSRPSLRVAVLVALAATTAAAAPSREDQRNKLREQLGLPDQPPPSGPAPAAPPDEPDPPDSAPPATETPPIAPDGAGAPPPAKPVTTYTGSVHLIVQKQCASCHGPSGIASSSGYRLTGQRAADYQAALVHVRKASPGSSPLLREASGDGHGGGTVLARSSAGYRTLLRWIEEGAQFRAEPVVATSPAATPPPGSPPPVSAPPTPSARTPRPTTTARAEVARPVARSVDLVEVTDPGAPAVAPAVAPAPPAGEPYAPAIHELLMQRCAGCHASAGGARGTRYVHRGDPALDYAQVRALVDPAHADQSLLVRKAVGDRHAAGAVLADGSAEHRALLRWIESGALDVAAPAPAAPAVTPPGPAAPDPAPAVDAVSGASPAPAQSRLGDGTPMATAKKTLPIPIGLPWGLQLNGKLDFSYERRDYRDHPFKAGRNAFATYHHFIYLSRSGAKDPFGFNVELLTRQFYEANARISAGRRFRLLIKVGKLLVPFGNEPLFHSSYGGRAGFDQEILPVVWARPGIGVQAQLRLPRGVTLANDLYLVAGHVLKDAGTVLNLQGDLSGLDDVKPAVGDRLGLSVGPFTGWYSLYVSPLGFGRTLVMQAVDFELWRPTRVKFLRDLVPSMGLMRADVSGGGRGEDYYHFGSYWSIAYTPIQYLSIQYRNGLRTHDNRRGVYFDPTRRDQADRGSHNISIYGRYKGAYVGLQFFWNLEKAGELDDDFTRVTVGYAF